MRSWGPGNGLPGMTANYLAAMDAMHKVRPAAQPLASPAVVSMCSLQGPSMLVPAQPALA